MFHILCVFYILTAAAVPAVPGACACYILHPVWSTFLPSKKRYTKENDKNISLAVQKRTVKKP